MVVVLRLTVLRDAYEKTKFQCACCSPQNIVLLEPRRDPEFFDKKLKFNFGNCSLIYLINSTRTLARKKKYIANSTRDVKKRGLTFKNDLSDVRLLVC